MNRSNKFSPEIRERAVLMCRSTEAGTLRLGRNRTHRWQRAEDVQ